MINGVWASIQCMLGPVGIKTRSVVITPVPGFSVLIYGTNNWPDTPTGSLSCGMRVFLLGRARWKAGTSFPFQWQQNSKHKALIFLSDTLPSALQTLTHDASKLQKTLQKKPNSTQRRHYHCTPFTEKEIKALNI